MERLTEEKQIGPFASLKDKAEAVPGAFATYDCLYAHMVAVTRLKAYEDTGLEPEEVTAIKHGLMGQGIVKITEFEGIPIKRMIELAQAEKDGRLVALPPNEPLTLEQLREMDRNHVIAYLPGEKVYDRFGTPWIIESAEIHLIQGELKQLFRCGHPGTEDYHAMYEDEIYTSPFRRKPEEGTR